MLNQTHPAQVRGQLSEGLRQMLGALITIDVHARDVVQELVDAGEWREGWLMRGVAFWGKGLQNHASVSFARLPLSWRVPALSVCICKRDSPPSNAIHQ